MSPLLACLSQFSGKYVVSTFSSVTSVDKTLNGQTKKVINKQKVFIVTGERVCDDDQWKRLDGWCYTCYIPDVSTNEIDVTRV